MTLPVFPRTLLYDAFGNNPRMVSAFEELIAALGEAVAQAEAVPGVSAALQSTAFLLLGANEALTAGRVLTAGDGIGLADDGARVTISVGEAVPHIDGGFPTTFIVTGATNLVLPKMGQLATVADVAASVAGSVTSFNTRTGAVTLSSADVTGALGYTPTSVTGLTGTQSVAAFKTGLSLVKADVGLGSVDNTADAAKNVLSATKLTTARSISITGDGSWTVSFDGSGNVTAALTLATVNASPGTVGGASKSLTGIVNAKGLVTSLTEQAIAISASQVTDFSTAADARIAAAVGVSVQAYDADLATIAGLTATTDNFIVSVASAWASRTPAQVKTTLALNNVDNTSDATKNAAVAALTNKDLTSGTNAFPTLNQNTTGSAAKWTTARNLAGNSVDGSVNVAFSNKFIVQGTADSGLSAAQFLGALGTGILKNTTTTGVLSIAVAADFPTLNQNTTGSAATLTTARNIDGQAFDGSAAITVIAPGTHAATSKATPVDADELPLVDSAASNVLKKLTWSNLKATLKTYFDTLYLGISATAAAATKLATARNIAGNSFDGTANISINDTDLSGAAWTAWTPTITANSGTFTSVSASGRYKQIGKTVFFSAIIDITTNGTAASWIIMTMPVASASVSSGRFQPFTGKEMNVNLMAVSGAIYNNSSNALITKTDGTYPGASGYSLCVGGEYEVA